MKINVRMLSEEVVENKVRWRQMIHCGNPTDEERIKKKQKQRSVMISG